MSKLKKFFEKLKFDLPDSRFELIETESGEPGISSACKKARCGYCSNEKHLGKYRKFIMDGDVSRALDKNEHYFRSLFSENRNKDFIFRRFKTRLGTDALTIYLNGMADANVVSDFIIRPLMNENHEQGKSISHIVKSVVQIGEVSQECCLNTIESAILDGKTALFIDGQNKALILETRGFEKRSVTTAENERTVRGPQEGFTESISTNVTLVRRIIKTGDLIVLYKNSGGENGTKLAVLYRKNVTNSSLITEIEKRLSKIDTGLVVSSGTIEQFIEDSPLSPLPQILATERPDRVASFLMNGAAALIIDGSPFALIMPATITALLNSPEDVYMRRPLGTFMRIVRYLGVLISLILPGYFVAVAMYHQGLLSTEVLSTLIKSREMVFEPLPFEMILLLFVFQLIREAGMRVPGSVGQAIGVIGGLILGQAAVSANLASTVILIIVALSGLGNLCIPDYSTQISASYFRFIFVIAAWLGGLLALTGAVITFIAYMANMKSFGVPFISPNAPKTYSKRPSILRGKIDNCVSCDDWINTSTEKENSINDGFDWRNKLFRRQ